MDYAHLCSLYAVTPTPAVVRNVERAVVYREVLASTCDLRYVPGVGIVSGVLIVSGMNDASIPIARARARSIVSRTAPRRDGAYSTPLGPPKTLSAELFGADLL